MIINIKLTTIKDVQEFVTEATNLPRTIDARVIHDGYIVDAKSMMGLFSLNLSEEIELRLTADDKALLKAWANRFNKWRVED